MGAHPTNSARLILLGVLLLIVLSGCGGSQTAPTNTALDSQSPAVTQDGPFAGIPSIPIDGEEAYKVSSADGNTGGDPGNPGDPSDPPPLPGDPPFPGDPPTASVLGADFLLMQGGYVDGTALVLGDDSQSEMLRLGPGNNLAFGLYKISGIAGFRPVSLNIEAIPQELGDKYYIGLANYSDLHWDWFGPVTFPEFQLDLMESGHQYVTHLGNLYFIMICPEGNIVRHERASVVLGPLDPPARPGAPGNLQASDGAFPDHVEVTWLPGMGAGHYEVWRSDITVPPMPPGDPGDPPNPGDPTGPIGGDMGWYMIGETPDTMFNDFGVPMGVPFAYKVRAVNPRGVSEFSNVDIGFAEGMPPPPSDCVVEGLVAARVSPMGPSVPVPGVRMFMTGYPQEILVFTDEQGYFRFEGVSPGLHMLAPVDFNHVYDPPYIPVELWPDPNGGPCQVTVSFDGMNANAHGRVWGFVSQSDYTAGPLAPGWIGLPGVEVWATYQGAADVAFGGVTDGNGYYAFNCEMDGPWRLAPWLEGYEFFPPEMFFSTPLPNPDGPLPPFMFEAGPVLGGGGGNPGDPGDPGVP